MTSKVIEKSSLLKDIITGTNRLTPLIMAMFDDEPCNHQTKAFTIHLLDKLSENRNVIALLFEDWTFPNPSLKLVNNLNLDTTEEKDIFQKLTSKLVSLKEAGKENVLFINPVNCIQFLIEENANFVKILCRWLHSLTEHFVGVVFVYHTDVNIDFQDNLVADRSLRYISNVILDFRNNAKVENLISISVTTKKKHPRTHLKEEHKNEYFDPDNLSYLTEEMLNIKEKKKSQDIQPPPAATSEPQSTFNLALKEDEIKARDELILPYMKNTKNENPTSQIYYNYDQYDDWDDEDPDDDLDF